VNCACGNAARYIDDMGIFTCAICPLKAGRDSIRLTDVPALLKWVRMFQRRDINGAQWDVLALGMARELDELVRPQRR